MPEGFRGNRDRFPPRVERGGPEKVTILDVGRATLEAPADLQLTLFEEM